MSGIWAIAVGLLAGLALLIVPFLISSTPHAVPQQPATVMEVHRHGRYTLVTGPDGTLVRLDTATGRTWRLSSAGKAEPTAELRWVPITMGE